MRAARYRPGIAASGGGLAHDSLGTPDQPGAGCRRIEPDQLPRVDSSQQRACDDDRRGILTEELRAEEKKLADLKQSFNNGEPERQGNERNFVKYRERVVQMRDDISRTERNIEALRREIANIR
nr:hypothetical protein [Massilia sp. Se16.2.3]